MKQAWQRFKDLFRTQKTPPPPKVKTVQMELRETAPEEKKQWWFTRKQMRQQWLGGFWRSKHRPHTGHQEKARRVRQFKREADGTLTHYGVPVLMGEDS